MISTARGIRPTSESDVGGLGGLDRAEDECNDETLAEPPAAEELFQAWPAETADAEDTNCTHDIGNE